MNNCWHIFPPDQLKPTVAGDGVCILAVPEEGCIKNFLGRRLRHNRIAGLAQRQQDLSILTYPYGIIFEGANEKSIEALAEDQSALDDYGFEIPCYNKQVISEAKDLLLSQSSFPKKIDPLSFCLLQGLTHLLPAFKAFPRIPIISLPKQPTSQRGILIVEDEEAQLELFRLLLESIGYSNIFLARNGIEALPILKARGNEIDLMLLNWAMPGMDGLTLLRHLTQAYPHTLGVILESGYPDTSYKNDFFKLRTNSILPIDYLVKPFLLEEFTLEVRVAMEYMRRRKLYSSPASI